MPRRAPLIRAGAVVVTILWSRTDVLQDGRSHPPRADVTSLIAVSDLTGRVYLPVGRSRPSAVPFRRGGRRAPHKPRFLTPVGARLLHRGLRAHRLGLYDAAPVHHCKQRSPLSTATPPCHFGLRSPRRAFCTSGGRWWPGPGPLGRQASRVACRMRRAAGHGTCIASQRPRPCAPRPLTPLATALRCGPVES